MIHDCLLIERTVETARVWRIYRDDGRPNDARNMDNSL